jgi:GNAT superfamily N-acetyltransferase
MSPVALGEAEEGLWSDCDLASLAENRLGDATDPRTLGDRQRTEWRARVCTEGLSAPSERQMDACFWLLEEGERVGTLALSRGAVGNSLLRLSSLYVLPTHRGCGVATRALERMRSVLGSWRYGIRLETCWPWQAAVRFYLRRGFWVRMWKRDLEFQWRFDAPPAIVQVDNGCASVAVDLEGERVVLAKAERDGDELSFEEASVPADPRIRADVWDASSTLSLALALHGWPLIRSRELWERCHWSDAGPPEALAHRIEVWEAWDRKQGYRVETPKIPGLEYPSWEELTRRWSAARGAP